MTLKNNRAPLLSNTKLCASFHHYLWIQTGVTVRKWLRWVLTSVILTFDLWPWPFAWTLLLSLVITPENFMMIRWWEHNQKGVTDKRTDRQTDWLFHWAAWSQLKISAWTKATRRPKYESVFGCHTHRNFALFHQNSLGPFYWHGFTLIPAWISNHTPSKMWDEITYPFPNFNIVPLKFGNG